MKEERLSASFGAEIFATDAAYELVEKGASFRDAYREIGLNLDALGDRDPLRAIEARQSTGTTGNLGIDQIRMRAGEIGEVIAKEGQRVLAAEEALAGRSVTIS